jgi:hypothetical protein
MGIAVNAPYPIRRQLHDGGWVLQDGVAISRTPWTYQRFLQGSRAEFCVAKHAYVSTWSGWFSDRTTAYLASGRPAIVQDTGFSRFLPTGEGLLAFRTPSEAMANVRSLRQNYDAHVVAARAVAEACFDSEHVLRDLLERSL